MFLIYFCCSVYKILKACRVINKPTLEFCWWQDEPWSSSRPWADANSPGHPTETDPWIWSCPRLSGQRISQHAHAAAGSRTVFGTEARAVREWRRARTVGAPHSTLAPQRPAPQTSRTSVSFHCCTPHSSVSAQNPLDILPTMLSPHATAIPIQLNSFNHCIGLLIRNQVTLTFFSRTYFLTIRFTMLTICIAMFTTIFRTFVRIHW